MKPAPKPTPETAHYWEAANRGGLQLAAAQRPRTNRRTVEDGSSATPLSNANHEKCSGGETRTLNRGGTIGQD